MYRQLHRELAKWTTSYTNMFQGIVKVDAKKYVCHSTLVIKMLIQYFFLKSNPHIPTMLMPTKAQQTSTSRLVLHN
jgi:hypothetical protein